MARTIGQMFLESASINREVLAILDVHSKPPLKKTYSELAEDVAAFSAGLRSIGIKKGDRVALLSDNRPRWILADLALLSIGAVDVPRGSDTASQEIWFILNHSESVAAIVQTERLLKRILEDFSTESTLKTIILMDDKSSEIKAPANVAVCNFSDLLQRGRDLARSNPEPVQEEVSPENLATIVYTSGTTGTPKGVMLTHANLTHQSDKIDLGVNVSPGDKLIAILPTWHVYERAVEYFGLKRGATLTYSDKRYLRDDLQKLRPEFLPCVPRMWESIYDAILDKVRKEKPSAQKKIGFLLECSHKYIRACRTLTGLEPLRTPVSVSKMIGAAIKALIYGPVHAIGAKLIYSRIRAVTGGQLKAAVSGGGSFASYLDDFFEVIGVPILNGYGLTETSPVLTARRLNHNVRGTVGRPIEGIQIQIRAEDGSMLAQGQTGMIWACGAGVMQGYYKNPEVTSKVLDEDGWFNTGDLGWITTKGDLVISGRAKDTIVLSSGENVEPEPIELAAMQSPCVSQILVVGQDQKSLGALVYPDFVQLAAKLGVSPEIAPSEIIANPNAQKIVRESIAEAMGKQFKSQEQVLKIAFLTEGFTEANGMLTLTMKPKRKVILAHYSELIDSMFSRN